MALTHKNRLKTAVSAVASSGLGAFTIGSAESGYRTFGASDDGNTFDVLIIEGTAWEVRTDCTYTHSGSSLARGTLEDSSTGSAIAFTSAAIVVETLTAGRANSLIRAPGGSTTQVQFNDAGTLAGASGLVWDKATNVLTLPGNLYFPNNGKLTQAGSTFTYVQIGSFNNAIDIVSASGPALSVETTGIRFQCSAAISYFWIPASGTYQFGVKDSATPTAPTLRSPGSRSGSDTNTGGANLTIQAGTGTGTGAASSIILQSPVATTSGTGAQTQTTGLTIKNGCAVPRATTVASLPAAASNTDAMLIVTDASATLAAGIGTTVAAGGANRVGVRSDGTNWIISF